MLKNDAGLSRDGRRERGIREPDGAGRLSARTARPTIREHNLRDAKGLWRRLTE